MELRSGARPGGVCTLTGHGQSGGNCVFEGLSDAVSKAYSAAASNLTVSAGSNGGNGGGNGGGRGRGNEAISGELSYSVIADTAAWRLADGEFGQNANPARSRLVGTPQFRIPSPEVA
jgi:hypothetical protein